MLTLELGWTSNVQPLSILNGLTYMNLSFAGLTAKDFAEIAEEMSYVSLKN